MAKDEIARLLADKCSDKSSNHSDRPGTIDQTVQTADDENLNKSVALNDRLIKELKSLKESVKVEQEKQKEEQLTFKTELKAAKQRADLLREELNKCERREEERVEEIKYLKGELERIQREKEQSEQTLLEPLEEERTELLRQLDELKRHEASLEAKVHALQENVKTHEATLSNCTNTIADLKNELYTVKQSESNFAYYEREIESLKKTIKAATEELSKTRDHLQASKRATLSHEYLRNVIISYLCNPSQRPHMLQVLCQLLDMTPEDLAKVNQL